MFSFLTNIDIFSKNTHFAIDTALKTLYDMAYNRCEILHRL